MPENRRIFRFSRLPNGEQREADFVFRFSVNGLRTRRVRPCNDPPRNFHIVNSCLNDFSNFHVSRCFRPCLRTNTLARFPDPLWRKHRAHFCSDSSARRRTTRCSRDRNIPRRRSAPNLVLFLFNLPSTSAIACARYMACNVDCLPTMRELKLENHNRYGIETGNDLEHEPILLSKM